ncbi:MAG: hypothetical protein UW97_C0018G0009 [Parcubacteria group bacterium GW2011_GWA2_45_15]|nr:MAG: hypothetical protein UW97_C0018G0009 [Parcubacteria group bacterium GW2011_GWA2_45_15]
MLMKKLLLSGVVASLLLPSLAFAAYNDVSLTTDVVLSVNGITVNVSGSSATIESIVVGSTNFIVTVESGSSFQVTAPDRNVLEKNSQVGIAVDICNGTKSTLGYTTVTGSDELAITITPSATLCTGPTADTSGGTGSSGGGGGGGGGGASVTLVVPTVNVTQLTNAEAVAAIKVQLISLIQQLIVLLNQQLQAMQASGAY